jgi:hypothetical protein
LVTWRSRVDALASVSADSGVGVAGAGVLRSVERLEREISTYDSARGAARAAIARYGSAGGARCTGGGRGGAVVLRKFLH